MKTILKSTLLLSLLFFSCKKETNAEENKSANEVVEKKETPAFLVELDLVIKKDDTLQLFYTEFENEPFVGTKKVRTIVKGNSQEQKINFKLPGDVFPKRLRIDFGEYEGQEPIDFKNFKVSYLDNTFEAKDTMFYQFFMPNKQIQWDRKNAVINVNKKDGELYDPQFLSREILEKKLEKMVQ